MRILVTGARGLVGRCLVRLASGRHDVAGLGRDELDVTDEASVERAFREIRPEAVLHCAAYTDVDGAEREPERARTVNARGAEIVASRARRAEALFTYVSTDYVFDGGADAPYTEEAEPSPLSSYGRSKLEGETRVAVSCPEHHLIVRTGWVYGPGKGFVDWARGRILRGEELPLVSDQRGSPTSAVELAEALLVLVQGRRGLYHYVNRGETSWLGLGRAVAEELGADARIRAVTAAELGRPAPRPAYSALSVSRFERVTGARVPGWREALHTYLQAKGEISCEF